MPKAKAKPGGGALGGSVLGRGSKKGVSKKGGRGGGRGQPGVSKKTGAESKGQASGVGLERFKVKVKDG